MIAALLSGAGLPRVAMFQETARRLPVAQGAASRR
jgi:hypothetical protein